MAINKVNYKGENIIDLSSDTVEESSVQEGLSFHGADGEIKTGTFAPQEKEITENGEVTPDDGKYLSKVTVNVPEQLPTQEKTVDVAENGTIEITPDEGYVLSKATFNVGVESAGSGGGIVDVDTLPTENIDANTVYRTKEEQQKDPVLYASMQGMVMPFDELLIAMSQGEITEVNITYTLVTELPETMEPFDEATFTIPLYILESDGLAYISPTGSSSDAITIGTMMGGMPEFGWIDDISNATEMGCYTLRGESFSIDHYWNYKDGMWSEFIATIDVSELPTENIAMNTIYRLTEMGALNMYISQGGNVMDYNALAEQEGMTLTYNLVDELPEVGEEPSDTTMPLYVVKDSGIAYMYMQGTFGPLSAMVRVPDCGWVSDPATITADGIYMYAAPGVVKYFVYKNNEFVEYSSGSNEAQFIECISNAELEHLILPEKITQIIPYACYGRGYREVTIPATVTSIGAYAFANCENLETIYFDGMPSKWAEIEFGENCIDSDCVVQCKNGALVIDGCVYEINDDQASYSLTGAANPANMTTRSEVLGLPVTSIGYKAFEYCVDLTSIIIPDSVTSIGEFAFSDCTGLASITIPDSVTNVGWNAFYNCTGLTSISIGNGVTNLSGFTFTNNTNLKNVCIGNSITEISKGLFAGCSSLESITIPFVGRCICTSEGYYQYPFGWIFGENEYDGSTATTQYYYGSSTSSTTSSTYYIPTSLKSVTVTGGNILYGAFGRCTSLTSITIGDSVTSIGDYAFNQCTGLTNVNIPDGVTSIGASAFYNCTGLTSVIIGENVTRIENNVFNGCAGLTSITIPNSVTFIGNFAFSGCTGLTSVHTDDLAAWCAISFMSSSANPLYYAKNLYVNGELLIDLIIPDNVASIGTWVFCGCTSLASVSIPESVTIIGDGAFSNCTGLTNIDVPNSVISIGGYAFYNCTGLTSITLGECVTSIGEETFYGCTGLTSVTIPNSVTNIGEDAFDSCTGLTGVYIVDLAAWCAISFANGFANPLYYAKNLYVNGDLVTDLIIPNGVTSIGLDAFYNCIGLTSVTIPDGVMSIGDYAFCNCSGLTNIYIPSSVTSLSGFSGCTGLTSITIPDGVTSIGKGAFSGCTGLTSITIPDGVTSIGDSAFSGCTYLEVINYNVVNVISNPYKNNYIFSRAGSDSSGITVTIGANVTRIPSYLFYPTNSVSAAKLNRPNITSVIFEEGSVCTSIGGSAFYHCDACLTFDFSTLTSIPTLGDNWVFSSTSSSKQFIVPDNLYDSWIVDDDWSAYASYIVKASEAA